MRAWILRGGVMLLVGTLLGALSGCGHDPNHGIDMEKARKATVRQEDAGPAAGQSPPPGEKIIPGHGG